MSKNIDPHLRQVLKDFSRNYLVKREACFTGLDFDALRTDYAERKDHVLERLEDYLAEFTKNAEARGSTVRRASTGEEANRLILDILERRKIKLLVKSKSMVSEETRLNAFLAEHGIEASETDLGEWIVQLGAELPTHMVMPAIHLTRKEVAAVFSHNLGRAVPDDIPSLVGVAREELRKKILAAGAGLTGANALIAESGSIMLITNEGNGRLVTTVPPAHIVLTSIEKVVPSIREALGLLRILTRNATGQNITSYVSFLAGPHAAVQDIILLDNHRSEVLADARFRDMLRCVKCSACLNVCPVYQLIGGRRFSHIYMGGIGSLFTAWIHGLKESKKLADLCMGCHCCEEYCAAKIPIADLIIRLKERLTAELRKPFWKMIAFNGVLGKPGVARTAFWAGRAGRPVISRRDGTARRLPPGLRKYDWFRALPAPAPKTFTALFKAKQAAKKPTWRKHGPKASVKIFTGCLIENFYPEIGLAAADVLETLGYEVKPGPASCCGFPPAGSGFTKGAKRAFRAVLDGLRGADSVVTLCPTCTVMLSLKGPELLDNEESRALAPKVLPFSSFLLLKEGWGIGRRFDPDPHPQTVTYHDSCHHKYILKAAKDSRKLLWIALGREMREMEGADSCCGFAGSFSVSYPEISRALLEEKLAAIEKAGADIVALDCPGCLLQIKGGLSRRHNPSRVCHTAELLSERIKKW